MISEKLKIACSVTVCRLQFVSVPIADQLQSNFYKVPCAEQRISNIYIYIYIYIYGYMARIGPGLIFFGF